MKTAILVDGGFYRRRAQSVYGDKSAQERAFELVKYCKRHLNSHGENNDLYRIFYYDCMPSNKRIFHPFLHTQIDLGKTELYTWTIQFLDELKKKRKFAIRLGKLAEEQAHYTIRPEIVKKLCNGTIKYDDLDESSFCLEIDQKGVDMKIGLDIASMSYKRQVDQIILISGDSDFVSAAKLARREGVDFILDPLGSPIKPDLFEHIDGLRTCDKAYTQHTAKKNFRKTGKKQDKSTNK